MPAGLVHTQSRPVYKPKEGAWEHVQGKELEAVNDKNAS
jgi:hypothetical protein